MNRDLQQIVELMSEVLFALAAQSREKYIFKGSMIFNLYLKEKAESSNIRMTEDFDMILLDKSRASTDLLAQEISSTYFEFSFQELYSLICERNDIGGFVEFRTNVIELEAAYGGLVSMIDLNLKPDFTIVYDKVCTFVRPFGTNNHRYKEAVWNPVSEDWVPVFPRKG